MIDALTNEVIAQINSHSPVTGVHPANKFSNKSIIILNINKKNPIFDLKNKRMLPVKAAA